MLWLICFGVGYLVLFATGCLLTVLLFVFAGVLIWLFGCVSVSVFVLIVGAGLVWMRYRLLFRDCIGGLLLWGGFGLGGWCLLLFRWCRVLVLLNDGWVFILIVLVFRYYGR